MSFLVDMLAKGYFPKEIPPPFTTTPFANFIQANPTYYPDPAVKYGPTKLVRHHLAQVGRNRRILSIPNPINFLRLVMALDANFADVFRLANSSPISVSKPVYQSKGDRAIQPVRNYKTIPRRRAEARAVSRYVLKTDITRFYGSIYTHSIPWAIHGKEIAKGNYSNQLFGNLLDQIVRQAQDDQTIGIPVGPDTSLLISEIILSAVDQLACQGSRGFRWYDDYELSGLTKGDCETLLVELEAALAEYELEVSASKTVYLELPLPLEEEWADWLRGFRFSADAGEQFKDINRFFTKAFEYCVSGPKRQVLRYAVRKLHGAGIYERNWKHVQNLLSQAALHEPEVLPHVIGLLNYYQLRGRKLQVERLEELFCEISKIYASRLVGSEVAWALWGFLQFKMKIPQSCIDDALSMEDDLVSLLLLDANSKGLVDPPLDLQRYSALVKKDAFRSEHWLLAYEGVKKKWLKASKKDLNSFKNDPHVKELLRADVYFYNEDWKFDESARHVYGTPFWLQYNLPDMPPSGESADSSNEEQETSDEDELSMNGGALQ